MSDYTEELKQLIKNMKSQMFRVGYASSRANNGEETEEKNNRYFNLSDDADSMMEQIFTLIDNKDKGTPVVNYSKWVDTPLMEKEK